MTQMQTSSKMETRLGAAAAAAAPTTKTTMSCVVCSQGRSVFARSDPFFSHWAPQRLFVRGERGSSSGETSVDRVETSGEASWHRAPTGAVGRLRSGPVRYNDARQFHPAAAAHTAVTKQVPYSTIQDNTIKQGIACLPRQQAPPIQLSSYCTYMPKSLLACLLACFIGPFRWAISSQPIQLLYNWTREHGFPMPCDAVMPPRPSSEARLNWTSHILLTTRARFPARATTKHRPRAASAN